MTRLRRRPPGPRTLIGVILLVAILAGGWVALAPVQLGGSVAYVVTSGSSMRPGIHAGDLVATRRAAPYTTGQVVAYSHPGIGLVLHRIVAEDSGRFTLRGDNNSWDDSYRPVSGEVAGRLWLHVPRAGGMLGRARTPPAFALLSGMIGILALSLFERPKRRRGGHGPRPERPPRGSRPLSPLIVRDWLAAGALLAVVVAAALAVIAYRPPVERGVVLTSDFEQRGVFDYSAPAPAGVYDGDRVETGAPVFTQLTPELSVRFTYQLASDAPRAVEGRQRLVAQIGHENGWRRTVELAPETAFTGDSFAVQGMLDLAQVRRLITAVEQQSGVENRTYTVAIVPLVQVTGLLAGTALQEQFSPRLAFRLDPQQLVLERSTEPAVTDVLRPTATGSVRTAVVRPNSLSMLGMSVPVARLRLVALVALIGAGLTAAAAMVATVIGARATEPEQIAARYGELLLEVQGETPPPNRRTMNVARIDDLVKLATQKPQLILHCEQDGRHLYQVIDGDLVYQYEAKPAAPRDAGAA